MLPLVQPDGEKQNLFVFSSAAGVVSKSPLQSADRQLSRFKKNPVVKDQCAVAKMCQRLNGESTESNHETPKDSHPYR